MKENRIQRNGNTKRTVLAVVAVTLLVVGCVAVYFACSTLRAAWLEQCVVTDVAAQVDVTGGTVIKHDIILAETGIREGVNLAEIDYNEVREKVMKRIPNLLSLEFTRRLPGRLLISYEERKPIVRLNFKGNRKFSTGRVADAEGVVYLREPGTQLLPVIVEAHRPGTPLGERLQGHCRAALTLLDVCRNPEYATLNVLEVDTSKTDFITCTLGNYFKLEISWDGMDAPPSDKGLADLRQRLDKVLAAMNALPPNAGTGVWYAVGDIKNISLKNRSTLP